MRQIDSHRVAAKFLLKQFLTATSSHNHEKARIAHQFDTIQHETTRLKQENSNLKLQYEKTIASLQSRLHARDAANAELQKKVQVLQKVNDQLKRGVPASASSLPDSSYQEIRGLGQSFKEQKTKPGKGWSDTLERRLVVRQHSDVAKHPGGFAPGTRVGRQPQITPVHYGGRPMSTTSDGLTEIHGIGKPSYGLRGSAPTFRLNKRRRDGTPTSLSTVYRSRSASSPFAFKGQGHSVQSFSR